MGSVRVGHLGGKSQQNKGSVLNAYAGVKFRNEFKRGFYESMAKAERVSKKQLEIMNQMLDDKCVLLDFKDIFERYEGMAQSSECKAQFQANIAKYKKIYLSGRKNKTEE